MHMKTVEPVAAAPDVSLSDTEIVRRVLAGDRACFEVLIRRHNQQVYRVARAVLKDEDEVEDVMQQAYVNAFTNLDQFEERARFSTWLIRITLNEAFRRRRGRLRLLASTRPLLSDVGAEGGGFKETIASEVPDPERQAYAQELHRLLEYAVDNLPETYRLVFMLRDIEGLNTFETCQGLGLSEEAVKTRLHRARRMIRRTMSARIGPTARGAFAFHASRCDRIVASVLARISAIEGR
jgi:RNA polymerase sigma-70 factor, ECF subfamily